MNIAIKCALIEAGIMKLEAEEPDIKELKTLMTSCEKLQQRTVKGSRILSNKGNHYLVESIYHSNLTKAQKMLIKTLKSGTSTLDDIRSHFHVRTVSSLVKRDIIQINVKPVVKIK